MSTIPVYFILIVSYYHHNMISYYFRLHSQYLSGSQAHRSQESQLVTSVVLERNEHTGTRLIPVIQEELRTPSPSVVISRSASPALLTITNQVSPTIISLTPATPQHPKIRITISDNNSEQNPHCLESPHSAFLKDKSCDSISSGSVHSAPCNVSLKHSLLDLDVSEKQKGSSLIDLDESSTQKTVSVSSIPKQSSKLPDILNFPTPALSVSCPTVNK